MNKWIFTFIVLFNSVVQAETTKNLTIAHINKVYPEAVTRWVDAGYAKIEDFNDVEIRIEKIDVLGLHPYRSKIIILNVDACGSEWYVDEEPQNDNEFEYINGRQVAKNGEPKGRMDLFTVVVHELGHVIGRPHRYDTVMSPVISLSRRYTKYREDKR